MLLAAEVVDWEALGKVVAVSFVAGVGVPAIFAIGTFAMAQLLDSAREERLIAAVGYALLALAAAAACLTAIVYGVVVLTQK